jgi:hypothetical protein
LCRLVKCRWPLGSPKGLAHPPTKGKVVPPRSLGTKLTSAQTLGERHWSHLLRLDQICSNRFLLTPLKNLFWAVARAVSGTAVQTGLVHGAREGCPPASAIGCWVPNWAGGGPFTGTLVEQRAPCRTAAACPLALPAVRFSSRESHGAPSFSRRLVGTTT